MKNAFLLVLFGFCFGFAVECTAQEQNESNSVKNRLHGTVEIEVSTEDGKTLEPEIKAFLTYGGKSKLGAFCWVQGTKTWGQAYCGPTYQPRKWLQVGVGVGAQTGKNRFQAAAFLWAGRELKGKMVSDLLIIERNGWYRNVFSVEPTKKLALGLVNQKGSKLGGRVEYKLSEKFALTGEMRFGSHTTYVVGAQFKF